MKVVTKRCHYGPESIFPSQNTIDQNTGTDSRTGINVWMKKQVIQEFLLRSGDQNSVQCCLVSATAGDVPGWHEIKYRVLQAHYLALK